jgi:antitoxin ParD1/3/4
MKGQLPCLQAGSAPTIQTSDCLGDTKWCRDALMPQMAGFVRNAVDAGEYASKSEAIGDAVREWKERRDLLGYTVEELRGLVQEDIDSGPSSRATMADM